jgi:hypothetical protein
MARDKGTDNTVELLRDMLIVQLGLAKVPLENIRAIAKCDKKRINRLVALLRQSPKKQNPSA